MKSTLLLNAMIVGVALAANADEGRLLRFPATNGTDVVFSYAGDLYKAPLAGGEHGTRPMASILPSPGNTTAAPRFT